MFNTTQFQNKVVLITGASRGIGQALLQAFAKVGALVVGTATTEAGAQLIDQQLSDLGAQGLGAVLELTQGASLAPFVDKITKAVGAPAILVNNAGVTRDNLLLRMKESEWDQVIATNLTGVFGLTKACLKGMLRANWGRVIHLSSVVAVMGNPGQINYCATKAGLLGMTKSLAQEVGSRGITVNAIAPGFIETDMTAKLLPEQREAMLARIPSRRFGRVEEVAHLAVYLASEEAAYLQGQTLHINGGLWMG